MNQQLGIKICSVRGVPVYLKPSWFLLMLLVSGGYGAYLAQFPNLLWHQALTISSSVAILVALGVLVHESAHALSGVFFRLRVEYISMTLWGGVTKLSPGSPLQSFLISVAGPLINALYASLLYLLANILSPSALTAGIALAANANLLISFFNLVPSYPLDGGHALEALLTIWLKKREKATRITAWVGLALIPLMAVATVYSGAWRSSLGLVLAFMMGYYIWSGSFPMLTALQNQKAGCDPLAVRQLMRPAVVLNKSVELEELQQSWDGRSPLILMEGQKALAWVPSENIDLLLQGQVQGLDQLAYPLASQVIPLDALRIDVMEYFNGFRYQQLSEEMRQGYQPIVWPVSTAAASGQEIIGLLKHSDIATALGREIPAGQRN